jgi:hypothetical protein
VGLLTRLDPGMESGVWSYEFGVWGFVFGLRRDSMFGLLAFPVAFQTLGQELH